MESDCGIRRCGVRTGVAIELDGDPPYDFLFLCTKHHERWVPRFLQFSRDKMLPWDRMEKRIKTALMDFKTEMEAELLNEAKP